jgi:hypothetical protein
VNAHRTTRQERREVVEPLLREDASRSDRSLARLAAVSHTMVANTRLALVAAGEIAVRAARPDVATQDGHGNLTRQAAGEPSAARQHGVHSEAFLAPLRMRHLEQLRAKYPTPDEALLAVRAGRLARFDVLTDYIDRRGVGVLVTRDGNPKPAATLIASLENAIEKTHLRLTGASGKRAIPARSFDGSHVEVAAVRERLSVERREQLWRRHAEAYDDLLYAFLEAEGARRAKRWKRSPRGRLHWLTWPTWKLWNRACWWCWHAARWMALRPGEGRMRRRRGPWMGWWLDALKWNRDRRQRRIDERKARARLEGVTYRRLVGALRALKRQPPSWEGGCQIKLQKGR